MSADPARLVAANALSRVPLDVFDRLGARLRELEVPAAREEALRLGRAVPIELRGPLRRRALRARTDDAAVALRLLCFDDAVPADDVARVFGAVIMGALLGSGVLVRHASQGVRSLLTLTPLDHVMVLGDALSFGGDAVMAVGATTIGLSRSAEPVRRVGRVLDLGCGAGAVALHVARDAEWVVAVDVNPRAALLGRINAVLNRIDNVEFRVGDLFAPVADEQFDLVLSQPPFVPRPDGVADATYLFGGHRGDELTLRLLAELPPRLAAGGRALVLTHWPRLDATPVSTLARAALGPTHSIVSLEVHDVSVEELAASYAAAAHPTFDASYVAQTRRYLEHLDALGVRAITQALMLVGEGDLTVSAPLSSAHLGQLSGADLAARVAAERLRAGDRRTLLKARLRLVDGLAIERVWKHEGAPAVFSASHGGNPLVTAIELSPAALEVLREVDKADDVGTAIAWVSARHRVPRDKTLETLLPVVETALRQGVLVPRA